MTQIVIFQIVIFTIYIIFAWTLEKKPQPSISDSWYVLRKRNRLWPVLFTITLWTFGIPFTQIDDEWFRYGGVCLMLVGTAPMFKQKIVDKFHEAGAIGAIGFCLYGLYSQGNPYATIIVGVSGIIIAVFSIKNKIWWIEIVSFYVIEISLIINL